MEGLTLTQREQGRLQTLNQVLEGWMGVRKASETLYNRPEYSTKRRLALRHQAELVPGYQAGGPGVFTG